MFLTLNKHDYVRILLYDDFDGETHQEQIMHRFAFNDLGEPVGPMVCIDKEQLEHNKRCPACLRYEKLLEDYEKTKAYNIRDNAKKMKPQTCSTAIIYNCDDNKHQILQYTRNVHEELSKLKRINGTVLGYEIGIRNNKTFNGPDKKWYKAHRLDDHEIPDKDQIPYQLLQQYEKVVTPLEPHEMEYKLAGEIKIVEG